METSNLSRWFWPSLSLLLFVLWLWTLLRQRRAAPAVRTPAPELAHQAVEVEDALKAAYTLQEARGAWSGEELARSMDLSETMAEKWQGHSLPLAGPRRTPWAACT